MPKRVTINKLTQCNGLRGTIACTGDRDVPASDARSWGAVPVNRDVTRLDQTYQEDRLILALVLIIVSALAIGWIAGEATDRRGIRLVCGPLFTIAIASIAAGAAALHTSFDSSTRYSGATKNFVSALVAAIDRGDAALAHDELQRFNGISSETYEGGMFLKWLNESASRLNSPAQGAEPVEATRVDASVHVSQTEPTAGG